MPTKPAFDLDEWIDGTTGVTGTAKIYRDHHLLAELSKLEKQLEIAKAIPASDRGVNDKSPEQIQLAIDGVAKKLDASSLTLHIQDRTQSRRRKVVDDLKESRQLDIKNDDDLELATLAQLADSIVKVETSTGQVTELAEGFPLDKLKAYRDKSGDSALITAWETFNKVTGEAPSVTAPLSRISSSGRRART